MTVVDRDGVIYRQVYGAAFELPWLIEPLKELVFNRPQPGSHLISDLVGRIKLFCTVYDPNTGRYKFDYSLFVGIAVGAVIVLAVAIWLLVEIRRTRRSRKESYKSELALVAMNSYRCGPVSAPEYPKKNAGRICPASCASKIIYDMGHTEARYFQLIA